ncbi:MAG: hypothetical protein H0S80_07740 [Desulfovibrionaceae bacterium]|nr:hypothetical protein [Desulfovibrionaceae bacterium]
MKKMDIVRLETSQAGTFGVLRMDGEVFCVTLEPPDRGNRPGVSCIPAGEYECRRVASPSFGDTFEIAGVPGRTHILFHQGNVAADTRGCVLLGRSFGEVCGRRAVVSSMPTFRAFLARCGDARSFTVSIEDRA